MSLISYLTIGGILSEVIYWITDETTSFLLPSAGIFAEGG